MICKIAEYEIEGHKLQIAESAIKEFLSEISLNEPNTKYSAFLKKETNKFIHFMEFNDLDAENSHRNADYTRKFADIIYPICSSVPEFTNLEKIMI